MLDDVRVFSRLDSVIYGAMAHATEVVAAAIDADMAAACVFGVVASQRSYITCPRLGLSATQIEALGPWPEDEGSLFALIRSRNLCDSVFQPREVVDELTYARLPLYRRLSATTTVDDALCMSCPLGGEGWCALAFLRCGDGRPFAPQNLDQVERFKPAVERVLRRAVREETQPRGVTLRHDGAAVVHEPVSTAELLAKLSRTELHVLGYLRNNMTERAIAKQLNRSPHTIHVHVKNIYRKLGITSRKHLAELFND